MVDRQRIRVQCTKYQVPGTKYEFVRYKFYSESILVLRLPAGGTWYMVPSTNMWNLSQVRQGL